MADTQRLISALNAYTGDMDTLNAFVTVAEEELGDRWTETIYQSLGNLDASLKEKLDHAFQYNGAVVAWNEAQGYLEQSEVDVNFISERIPILEHWLAFFGQQGTDLVNQVKQRLQESTPQTPQSQPNSQVLEQTQETGQQNPAEINPADILEEPVAQENPDVPPQQNLNTPTQQPTENIPEDLPVDESEILETSALESLNEEAKPDENPEQIQEAAQPTEESSIKESAFVIEEESADSQEEPEEEPEENTDGNFDLSSLLDEDFLNKPLEDLKEFVRSYTEENKEDSFEPAQEVQETQTVKESPQAPEDLPVDETEEIEEAEDQEEAFEDEIEPADEILESQEEEPEEEIEKEILQTPAADSVQPTEPAEIEQPKEEDVPVEAVAGASVLAGTKGPEAEGRETVWIVDKVKREIDFLDQLEAWMSARCVSLGGIELFSYKYYGFLADVSHVLAQDIQQMLSDEQAVAELQAEGNDTLKQIQDKQISLESFVQEVKEKLGTDPIPLLKEEITAMEMRKALGAVDESTENEYFGPAPDGFEMVEDPFETKKEEKTEPVTDQEAVAEMNKIEQETTDLPVVETLEPVSQVESAEPPPMPVAENTSDASGEETPAVPKKGILSQMEVEPDSTPQTEE